MAGPMRAGPPAGGANASHLNPEPRQLTRRHQPITLASPTSGLHNDHRSPTIYLIDTP
ncbi:hypothetical protein OSH93_03980 [Mycobacterium ulcerans]